VNETYHEVHKGKHVMHLLFKIVGG